VPAEWDSAGDRLALVFKVAGFALLPGIVGICVVSAQRLDPTTWVGRMAKPNSALDINTRFILNTFEQFMAYLVAMALVALYSPAEEARALPILTMLFVLGRTLFWIGYSQEPVLTRLRIWLHLLPDGGGVYLVCPIHFVWHSHTAVLVRCDISAPWIESVYSEKLEHQLSFNRAVPLPPCSCGSIVEFDCLAGTAPWPTSS
jgi:uncharacterized MAPEG superfamily protein